MKHLFWIVIAVVLATAAVAQDFTAEFSPGQQSIDENEMARYNVTIFHTFETEQFFEIYSPEVLWDIRTKDPLRILPGKVFTTQLLIQPLNINPGLYGVPVHVKRTGSSQTKKALLYMEVSGMPTTTTYLPAIRGTVLIPASIDPREEIMITVELENQNRRNLTNIDIKARSTVINQDFVASLDPLERKTLKFSARIDPRTQPQRDVLKITVIATEKDKGYQFDLPSVEYSIRPYGQAVPTIELTEAFLKTTRLITVLNDANMLMEEPFAYAMPWYTRVFTFTSPKASVEHGKLLWDLQLKIGESARLRVVTTYRPFALAILLAAILFVLYRVFRSPLTVSKSASVISTREGGISELKILLELRNRSGMPVHNVNVIDLVPRIAELLQEYDVGTLTPTKILKHDRKGTIIKYEVGDLLPYEERIISYKIKSSLSILGGVSLPEAVAKFQTPAGKERTTSSNAPSTRFLGE